MLFYGLARAIWSLALHAAQAECNPFHTKNLAGVSFINGNVSAIIQ